MARFRGGKEFERKLKDVGLKLGRGATVRVGFLEGATYPNGVPIALVAFWQEFGTRRAPARPFFRPLFAEKSPEWPAAIAGLVRDNDYDVVKALDLAGHAIEGQLRESIIKVTAPPLSPVTLMLRTWFPTDHSHITGKIVGQAARAVAAGEDYSAASTKPLVWSGVMLNTVDHEVVERG